VAPVDFIAKDRYKQFFDKLIKGYLTMSRKSKVQLPLYRGY